MRPPIKHRLSLTHRIACGSNPVHYMFSYFRCYRQTKDSWVRVFAVSLAQFTEKSSETRLFLKLVYPFLVADTGTKDHCPSSRIKIADKSRLRVTTSPALMVSRVKLAWTSKCAGNCRRCGVGQGYALVKFQKKLSVKSLVAAV